MLAFIPKGWQYGLNKNIIWHFTNPHSSGYDIQQSYLKNRIMTFEIITTILYAIIISFCCVLRRSGLHGVLILLGACEFKDIFLRKKAHRFFVVENLTVISLSTSPEPSPPFLHISHILLRSSF